jgi:hypothetical protein
MGRRWKGRASAALQKTKYVTRFAIGREASRTVHYSYMRLLSHDK